MRRDIAKLIVRAAHVISEERQVLAAEKLPTGVWYAIVDDGQLWHEALYPAHGTIVRWTRTPINILDGANGATALRQRRFREHGEGEVKGLDLTLDRHKHHVMGLQSQYRRAARRMVSGSIITAVKMASRKDMLDALDHMSDEVDYKLDLKNFDQKTRNIKLDDLWEWDDLSSWPEWDEGELEKMDEEERQDEIAGFRGSQFADHAKKWIESGKWPTIVLVEISSRHRAIGDGRGRVSVALGMNIESLPATILTEKKSTSEAKASTASLIAQCKSLGISGRVNFDGVSVGKRMGKTTYVHRDYRSVFPGVMPAAGRLPRDFDYAVVKADSDSGCFSFIECADFDTEPEPTVGRSARVCGEKVTWRKGNDDPQIYHHKWSMVGDDYEGFDVAESMRRSIAWKSVVGKDAALSSRIGTKSVWEKEVLPRLDPQSSVQYAGGMDKQDLPVPKGSPKSASDQELLHLQEAWQEYEGTFKPKQKALTTDEYRVVYPYLKELNNRERKNFTAAGEKAMKASGVWYDDAVEWHAVGSFFDLSIYRGVIVQSKTGPKVRLEKPVAGKTSIRWHKGFKKA